LIDLGIDLQENQWFRFFSFRITECIYIDPPYNTGNENWVYNDNVNSPMIKEWLSSVVDKEDMTRHDMIF